MKQAIYADYNATHPCSREHLLEVVDITCDCDANPSSIHPLGLEAKICVEKARESVGRLLGVSRKQIVFNSGASEGNNAVIYSKVLNSILPESSTPLFKKAGQIPLDAVPNVILTQLEHASVYEPLRYLESIGLCNLRFIKNDDQGRLDVNSVKDLVDDQTVLFCCMKVNNELGNVYDVAALAEIVKNINPAVHVHCDAVQAMGKLPLSDTGKLPYDSMSLSAHKVGGVKGSGCLYLKDIESFKPVFRGGGQEFGKRSGTHNVQGIVSLGLRANAITSGAYDIEGVKVVVEHLKSQLEAFPDVKFHGDLKNNTGNTINFHIENIRSYKIMAKFEQFGICASLGSACSSASARPSRVIKNLGMADWVAENSVRLSFGPGTKISDSEAIGKAIAELF